MEYVYAAMLLHSAKQEINEASLEKVLQSAGTKADSTKLKAMVAALKDVNIEEAIKSAALPTAAAPTTGAAPATESKQDNKEDAAKSEAAAAEGLGALFG